LKTYSNRISQKFKDVHKKISLIVTNVFSYPWFGYSSTCIRCATLSRQDGI